VVGFFYSNTVSAVHRSLKLPEGALRWSVPVPGCYPPHRFTTIQPRCLAAVTVMALLK
jgi:hypothetical protein